MSKQIKKLKNKLIDVYTKLSTTNTNSNKGEMTLLVGIRQLTH